tara:strand:- start:60 stop:1394 length:1335 start_codon:yes stop_codon:yes gene_type:complete
MIGFETIGNATVTIFDDSPVLSTDPWVFGKPYFGSWGHKYKIPKEQLENIKKSKYIFLSHGHPDHIDPDSFDLFSKKTLIVADHYGDRIFNDLSKNFKCIKLKSNEWFNISKNVRIKTFADWNQDSSIIIEILKENILFNLNDGNGLGWSKEIKKNLKNYKNRFLLKLINWGDADMINFYDNNNHFVNPVASQKNPCGESYNYYMNNWNCNYAIPFSSLHTYIRKDSVEMNKFATPLEAHYENFNQKDGILLPAFIKWDIKKNDYILINPKINNQELRDPDEFGDNWSDELEKNDEEILYKYFNKFEHLKKKFGFINFKVGNKDFNIKLSNRREGIKIQTPRNSLMVSIKNNIFDDILIGNFAKFQLINVPSLYPDFNPYVTKYGDNGNARSSKELNDYFDYYKLNSANFWMDFLKLKTEEVLRLKIEKYKHLYSFARKIKRKL